MKKGLLTILFLSALTVPDLRSQGVPVNEIITVDKVHDIVSVLSSNAMRGRKTFTPSVDRAASFITAKFKAIGLETLQGLDTYRQPFTVYRLRPGPSRLRIAGRKIPQEEFFYTSKHTGVSWDLTQKEVLTITESDIFSEKFAKANNTPNDQVILVDPSHRQVFTLYADHFGRETRDFTLNEGPTKLFVITETVQPESGWFEMNQTVEAQHAFNVVGKITGREYPDEYVLFSAHYDHIGILQPVEGDSIANGADDNASGTAGVVLLAEYFKQLGPQSRSLLFVGFTAEEAGGLGSQYFSRQLDPEKVKAMFNIEMIGKPSRFGPNTAFLTGFEMTDMGKILQKNLEDTPYMVYPDPYPEQNLFFRSDNATLARLGVPAHTISSAEIDKGVYYHTVNDDFKTLNLVHLTNMIRAIALSSGSIVQAEDTPTRIDPGRLN